jgi:hypothetical protein
LCGRIVVGHVRTSQIDLPERRKSNGKPAPPRPQLDLAAGRGNDSDLKLMRAAERLPRGVRVRSTGRMVGAIAALALGSWKGALSGPASATFGSGL